MLFCFRAALAFRLPCACDGQPSFARGTPCPGPFPAPVRVRRATELHEKGRREPNERTLGRPRSLVLKRQVILLIDVTALIGAPRAGPLGGPKGPANASCRRFSCMQASFHVPASHGTCAPRLAATFAKETDGPRFARPRLSFPRPGFLRIPAGVFPPARRSGKMTGGIRVFSSPRTESTLH